MNHPRASLYDLRMFLTTEYPCSYLPGRQARNLVADPVVTDGRIYTQLADLGFRRSGDHVYRPHCRGCMACRSLRIPVERFRPNRSQRRIWTRNQDVRTQMTEAKFQDEHFELFARYIRGRHCGGGMDPASPDSYWSFITSRWCPTGLCEFHRDRHLLAVAVVDRLDDGLSAVYTFFDPLQNERGLGTFAILWQIAEAQRLGLQWVYLGYWIEHCDKMAYKSRFTPHEVFIAERWGWMAVEE
ncbi:MAG TPA: arginyltransferase [Candidatus Competibacteraceae bacterium]|nr:arginyltransferase [Candidatus Contendobacter sp.]HRD48938.1 arginyltransferase [Candidatus Contendobacter sp.]HRF45928.1 arginyltransferase [Candidatus Competibacteraceae bacterium]